METDETFKKLFREMALEEAPDSLVSNVLTQIESESTPVIYHPLISKRGWWWIAIGVFLLCSLVYIPMDFMQGFSFPEFPGLSWTENLWSMPVVPKLSRTVGVGCLIFTLFSSVQFLWLNREAKEQYEC